MKKNEQPQPLKTMVEHRVKTILHVALDGGG